MKLHITDPLHITFPWKSAKAGVRVTLPEVSATSAIARVETTVHNGGRSARECTMLIEVRDQDDVLVANQRATQRVDAGADATFDLALPAVADPKLWSPAHPYLYSVHSIALADDGREFDRVVTRLGVRWFEFDRTSGFSLNGQPLKLVGANRHQTWPFIGNAVPNGLHRRDAEQMKETGFNWVRLSHYPHDPDFLDTLDEIGLIALAEGPTWMGVGGQTWVENLHASFRAMIRRDRNHPSIMMWNACINHSRGDDALGAIAKEEDPTRPRGQIDVPAPMDFRHLTASGNGALTIEHTGHTFPTFRGDRDVKGKFTNSWEGKNKSPNREYDLAQRHWEQTNAAYLKTDNSGLAVWAMYDYNTFHNATGTIAPHGVFDLFRIHKYSYWWHRAELSRFPTVFIVRISDTRASVFSNGERVRLSQDVGSGYVEVATRSPDEGFVLRHPPFHFDVDPRAVSLKAESIVNEAVVATREWHTPGKATALTLIPDRSEINADGSDLSRLVVSAVDSRGTEVDDSMAGVRFTIDGPGQIVGENPTALRAGKMIVLVQSSFSPGEITVTATADGFSSSSSSIQTVAVPPGVDLPADVVGRSPTRSTRRVLPPVVIMAEVPWIAFGPKTAQRNQWVESEAIMIPGDVPSAPITIRGGEYRVYTSEWTSKPGRVQSGDAVFVRVRAGGEAGDRRWADLAIGDQSTRFEVTAEAPPRRRPSSQAATAPTTDPMP